MKASASELAMLVAREVCRGLADTWQPNVSMDRDGERKAFDVLLDRSQMELSVSPASLIPPAVANLLRAVQQFGAKTFIKQSPRVSGGAVVSDYLTGISVLVAPGIDGSLHIQVECES